MATFTDFFGHELINVHEQDDCVGPNCPIHNPSNHPLHDAPQAWSELTHSMWRLCRHRQAHPDPDDYKNHAINHPHDCDGCCTTRFEPQIILKSEPKNVVIEPVVVTLSERMRRQCAILGVERWVAKKDSTDKDSYAEGRKNGYLEHDLLNDVRANISEWAVAQHYAQAWNGGVTYDNEQHGRRRYLPDVGTNLEVRTRRTGGEFGFWAYETEKEGYAVFTEVVNDITFEQVRILGWLPITECANPEWWDKDNKRFYVPLSALNDPRTLPLGDL